MLRSPENESPTVSEQVSIPIESGALAGVLTYPQEEPTLGRLVVAGPHPLLGGTKENNVVCAVAEGLAESGWITLRFDYRGVGDSDGPSMCDAAAMQAFWEKSEVPDEADRWTDLESACHWLHSIDEAGDHPLVVAAYSFGNLMLSQWIDRNGKLDAAICIAPTLDRHDLGSLAQSSIPKLAIAAEADFATRTESLHAELPNWKNTEVKLASDRDGHFFRGHEAWLCQGIALFLQEFIDSNSLDRVG